MYQGKNSLDDRHCISRYCSRHLLRAVSTSFKSLGSIGIKLESSMKIVFLHEIHDTPQMPPSILLGKRANATVFCRNTLNVVGICGFSATAGDFGCERVTCYHGNHSVAIKILIVAQGRVFKMKKICVACRVSYCNVSWIGCYY